MSTKKPNPSELHWYRVAEPVEITGRVSRRGGLLTLHADPTSYRRLE